MKEARKLIVFIVELHFCSNLKRKDIDIEDVSVPGGNMIANLFPFWCIYI